MLKWLSGTILFVLASTAGAAAQGMCGDAPIAPVIPSPADMSQKSPVDATAARHNAFGDIKTWQGALKSYRDCLNATVSTGKRDVGEMIRSEKPDKDKIAKRQQEVDAANHAFDTSVDDEEKLVNEFHAAQVAYCTRSDVDHATCPKN